MAITEQSRKNMYQRLEEVLGDDHAATLMEHLPPVGWADVATKQDLEVLRTSMSRELAAFAAVTNERFARIDDRFAAVDHRFDEVDRRFDSLDEKFVTKAVFYRTITAQTITLVIVMCTLAAAVR